MRYPRVDAAGRLIRGRTPRFRNGRRICAGGSPERQFGVRPRISRRTVILSSVRPFALISVVLLAGCGPAPAPSNADPTSEAWYGQTTQQLAAVDRDAARFLAAGQSEKAAAAITSGLPLEKRLLSVSRPTLTASEAVSDLDDLYGRMLLANRHYGWARLMFQKNLARWRNWRPETDDTVRRRKVAEAAIAACDRGME